MKPKRYPYSGKRKKPILFEIDGNELAKVILEANCGTFQATQEL